MKSPSSGKVKAPRKRNQVAREMIERRQKAGPHHTRELDVRKGRRRKPKHPQEET